MKMILNRFWNWYQTKIVEATGFLLVTHVLQIPHWIWSHEQFGSDFFPDLPIWLDYLFWSVDLIEMPALLNVILLFIANVKRKRNVQA